MSSWRRIEDNTTPPRIKCAANYQNARLALLQAETDGYDGALMLDSRGHVTEEARACLFAARGAQVVTPPVTSDILESITRETVIGLLREVHGVEVVERDVDRTELYVADEVFLCGTALGVTPVGSVDRFDVGRGAPGPITLGRQQKLRRRRVRPGREPRRVAYAGIREIAASASLSSSSRHSSSRARCQPRGMRMLSMPRAGQTAMGCLPRSRRRRHSRSIGVWKPPTTGTPASRIALATS